MANKVTQVYNDLDRYKPTKNQYTDEQDKRIAEMLKAYDASQNINGSLGINQGHRAGNASQEDILNAQNQAKWDKAINTVGETFSVGGKKDVYGGLTPSEAIYGKNTPATTTPTNTDYTRNRLQNVNTPVTTQTPTTTTTTTPPTTTTPTTTSTEDEFKKWYTDAQAKQDAINDEVTDTIKKWYSSKTEQEKSFYEQQLAMMQSQYEQNQQMLDQAKSQARQEADVLHQRMMKYLPEQMKAQGLSGLGISQSVISNAQNSLSSQLGDINRYYTQQAQMGNSEYQQDQMDLMQKYLSNQSKTDQEYEGALLDQYMRYSDRTSALDTQQREERLLQEQYAREDAQSLRDTLIQPNMQSLMEFNADGTIKEESYNNLRAYIDNLDLPDNLKTPLYTELDLYKNATPQNIGEKTDLIFVKNDAGKFKKNDTFHIKDANGNEYKLNSAGNVEDEVILDIAEEAYDVGDLFVYGDKLYIKHKDGVAQVDTNRDYDKIRKYLQ